MKKYLSAVNKKPANRGIVAVLFNKKITAFATILLVLATSFNASAGKISHRHKTNKKTSAGVNITGPVISYTSPQTIVAGVPITPIAPTSSGVGAFGFINAPVIVASGFSDIWGVVVDRAGNIFISEGGANQVIEMPAGGGPAVPYGSGFNSPIGMAVDAAGNLYVADGGNDVVKEVPAGNGFPIVLGTGFNDPEAVAVDATGNVYVVDWENLMIKKIPKNGGPVVEIGTVTWPSPEGVGVSLTGDVYFTNPGQGTIEYLPVNSTDVRVFQTTSTLADITFDNIGNAYTVDNVQGTVTIMPLHGGSNSVIATGLLNPLSLSLDGAGNVYVTDHGAKALKKLTPSGGYYISPALPAGLNFDQNTGIISGMATVSAPATNYTITAYSSTGSTQTVLNLTVNLPALPTIRYNSPVVYQGGVAITPLSPTNTDVDTYAYNTIPSPVGSGFKSPFGVATDAAGNVYVADYGNNALKKVAPDGSITTIGLAGATNFPTGVAVDAKGNIYVSNQSNTTVQELPAGGGAVINLGSGFKSPQGIAVDAQGNIYVADTNNNAIKMILVGNGAVITLGSGFNGPEGVAVDLLGNVYVADNGNDALKEIPVAGGAPVILATLPSGATCVALDPMSNIYTTDLGNGTVDKVPAGGGSPVLLGSGFGYSFGVNVDQAGNIYVAASNDNNVRVIKPFGGYYLSNPLPAGLSFNSSTGTITGTPQGVSKAANYTVTAYNAHGASQAVVNMSVIAANAFLSSLTISAGNLTPTFLPTATGYAAAEAYTVSSVTVTPTASDPASTIVVNGQAVVSGALSQRIALTPGQNTVNIVVTNSRSTVTYSVLVTRAAASTNANLASLVLNKGALSPAFSPATTAYTDMVSNGNASVTITPTVADTTARIKVNGVAQTSGHASAPIALNVGSNPVTVTVTAQDGVIIQTYSVNVIRPSTNSKLATLAVSSGTIAPAFSQNTITYADAVLYAVSSIKVTPSVVVAASTITVNGSPVASGSPSQAIPLTVGSNAIAIKVTAQDGVTITTYTVNVTRNPASSNDALSGLTISKGALSPAFTPATTTYTDMVSNGNASVTVTPKAADATATITVNSVTVASGAASGAVALSVGSNNIAVVVTAQDGAHVQTYNINVIRPSTNAKLVTLKLSTGALTPAFNSNTTGYTASVDNDVASLTITPTTEVTSSTIRVNGTQVQSGNPSGAIALNVGANTITTVITAQDGVTTDTYTITVTRAMAGDNTVYEPVGVEKPAEKPSLINDGITVHEGLSPNGDGINDFLQIDNISNYPENKLTIMNWNGMLVFEIKGYDNNARVFEGHSNKNGQMQLPGTYFYQLDYTVSGTVKHKTGFIVLKY